MFLICICMMTNAMKHTFLCYQSLDKLLREKLDQMFCSFLFGCLFYYWFVRVLWEQFFWKQEQSFVVWVVFDSTFRNLNIRFSQKSVTQVLTNLSREVSLSVGKFSLKLSCYKAFSWSIRRSLFPSSSFHASLPSGQGMVIPLGAGMKRTVV